MAFREGEIQGWRALTLENEALRLTVLPEKGADLYELVDLPSGIDPLFKGPWGLLPPGSPPREGSGDVEFLANYEGAWQELFPNVNEAASYGGRQIPFHGEVATLPWDVEAEGADTLRCTVRCRETPFLLERLIRLEGDQLVLAETVTNESSDPAHFVWGHHCVVGPPFLEPGCRLHTPARTITTRAEVWEETARLAPGQREPWPRARLRDGGTIDLSIVPGPEVESHDDVYLTDLEAGWAAVENPHLGLTFRLEWDPLVFRRVIVWQPYGGAMEAPLQEAYALGVEPWTTHLNLEEALVAGEATELAGGATLETVVRARFERSPSRAGWRQSCA